MSPMGADDATTVRLSARSASSCRAGTVLPGRTGGLAFAYLVVNRRRAVGRDELIELLWPQTSADPGEALSALLSRARTVGADSCAGAVSSSSYCPQGRGSTSRPRWTLPRAPMPRLLPVPGGLVDAAAACVEIAGGGFLGGDEAPWAQDRRRSRRTAAARAGGDGGRRRCVGGSRLAHASGRTRGHRGRAVSRERPPSAMAAPRARQRGRGAARLRRPAGAAA